MAWISTRGLVVLAIIGLAAPVMILTGRVLYAATQPVPPRVLALDAVVLGAGTLGVAAFLGIHLQSAVARPLREVQHRLDAMAGGRYDEACPAAGPQEIRDLAASVDALAQATEKRLAQVTQKSGVVAMGTVLNGVAHEVSNPLAHMHLSTEVLLRRAKGAGDGEALQALERVARGLDRLEEVVKTLRQTGGGRGAYEPARLVQAGLIVAQRSLLMCNLEVELKAKQKVDCVPSDIVQALVALLQNAGESGGKHVHVRTHDEDGFVAFDVEDDGGGMAHEIEEQAGQPFVTTKRGHPGLGLHHAEATAKGQGGHIHQERLAAGTRFVMTLPSHAPETAWDA